MTADLDLDHAVSVDELERRLAALLASVDAADVEDLDDADEFPTELTEALNRLGVQRCYVPTRFGGLLDDYPDAGRIVRSLARTDVTLAVAHGKTFLGAVSAWVAGNDEQREQLADLVCERHLNDAPAPPSGFAYPGFEEPLVDRYQDRSDRSQL